MTMTSEMILGEGVSVKGLRILEDLKLVSMCKLACMMSMTL